MQGDGNGEVAIEARDLFHIYRGRELETIALRGADLALERGSWTSVMGPSGSGKSTLLQVMAGLLEPSGGSVILGGYDITRLSPAERARRRRSLIGVVLQRDNLHPLLDAADNVARAAASRVLGRAETQCGHGTRDVGGAAPEALPTAAAARLGGGRAPPAPRLDRHVFGDVNVDIGEAVGGGNHETQLPSPSPGSPTGRQVSAGVASPSPGVANTHCGWRLGPHTPVASRTGRYTATDATAGRTSASA